MKKGNISDDHIDHYLSGALAPEVQKILEERMHKDPSLSHAVELQYDVRMGIDVFAKNRLKALLKESEQPHRHLHRYNSQIPMSWLSLAASVMLLLGISYFLAVQPADYPRLANAYYQPYPNVINPVGRSADAQPEDALGHAMHAYESGAYGRAIALFAAYDSLPVAYGFYLGLCYYETGQPSLAIARFEQVTASQADAFYDAARWYQALACLKSNQPQQAKANLRALITKPNPYQAEALALADALDSKFW